MEEYIYIYQFQKKKEEKVNVLLTCYEAWEGRPHMDHLVLCFWLMGFGF